MRVLHVFRAPVGGLYRHVRDLVRGQRDAGHEIGLICDSTTGGEAADLSLARAGEMCSLGIIRVAMPRLPGPADLACATRIVQAGKALKPDIIHGHGAKGGLYARLAARRLGAKSVYTPHGGVLHYDWSSPAGMAFLGTERLLLSRTDGLVFVCAYERETFARKIGTGTAAATVVHNGLWPEDFDPVPLARDATDILFIGELRMLKGVDVLLEALAVLNRTRPVTATITGDGPDAETFRALARTLGIDARVTFTGALPARSAFPRGWLMTIPSRAESFPYMVLEAVAAGKPLIASSVGGIPEVLDAEALVPPQDPGALADAISRCLADRPGAEEAARLRRARFQEDLSAQAMCERICAFYESL